MPLLRFSQQLPVSFQIRPTCFWTLRPPGFWAPLSSSALFPRTVLPASLDTPWHPQGLRNATLPGIPGLRGPSLCPQHSPPCSKWLTPHPHASAWQAEVNMTPVPPLPGQTWRRAGTWSAVSGLIMAAGQRGELHSCLAHVHLDVGCTPASTPREVRVLSTIQAFSLPLSGTWASISPSDTDVLIRFARWSRGHGVVLSVSCMRVTCTRPHV